MNSNIPDSEIWGLVVQNMQNDSSKLEQQKIDDWVGQSSKRREVVEQMKKVWELTPEEDYEVNVQEAWKRFQVRIRGQYSSDYVIHGTSKKNKTDRKLIIYRTAAAVLLIVFMSIFSWRYLGSSTEKQVAATAKKMEKVATNKGERLQVRFSDGSKMTLNASSSLRFPKKFKKQKREVYLNGEAYFDISHVQNRPFIVHTSNAKVKVLGTKFNVKAWKGRKSTIGVQEGIVSVALSDSLKDSLHKKDTGILLKKGQAVSIQNNKVKAPFKTDIANLILWTGGGMYFNDKPFGQVVQKIERNFGVDITTPNKSLQKKHFTSTFENADLDKVLKVVSSSMGINYFKTDSTIVFRQ